ncbi:hypothetical protein NGA_2086900 [Nannochloropsis gaditana CCMP526]|uniref:RNAse P, Rpr2/Rpp21 subunit n=1 Tax=Nannochloropsis gaditana TaxID=72520 RepID=W7U723_9STRA|nr:hypothetical protein NGA_2086900 [Nannochloropsis gaditana CCMP526]EKU20200.1 hypothetical protein NGA_2086900 [Nannochloropsis gaditana CCMP526]EWM28656.1 RNAse P, Rpr2/Rpp21 subunit [Nannochloropsis gaditana]|eukprot:XP_005856161.1 hypothetical protein NGA_2086900 [Nannochloropsis gaditana CCMP526]
MDPATIRISGAFSRLLESFRVPSSALAPRLSISAQRGKPASDNVEPALLLRLDYLWKQALSHLPTNQTYSRALSRKFIRLRDLFSAHEVLHPHLSDCLCPVCGVILFPGVTARTRVQHGAKRSQANARRKWMRLSNQNSDPRSGYAANVPCSLKNRVTYACMLCNRGSRTMDGATRRSEDKRSTLGEARKAETSLLCPGASGELSSSSKQQVPDTTEEEDFIPLQSESFRQLQKHQKTLAPPRLLLDPKPRKRKRQEEPSRDGQKSVSRSLGQVRGFLASFQKG